MLPIFDDYIKFLKDKTNELEFLKEGFYWYDRSIIKAFDSNGDIVKIARIKIDDDLNLTVKHYKEKVGKLEHWELTAKRYKEELSKLEKESIELIVNSMQKYSDRNVAVLSSGGKDSSVTQFLVKKCIENPEIIFNNTTLDCPDTYLHIKKEDNLTIINPKEGFYQWRERYNFIPTRFKRSCCDIFKEDAMIKSMDGNSKYLFFMGMRNQESSKRSEYGDEWKNNKWGIREWNAILPIRKWSELQIWLYILENNIDINQKYKKGYSRVGCAVACPYYTKSTWVLDKYWYPKMFNRWRDILVADFRENNKDIIMNCTEQEYLTCWNGGVLRENPTPEVVEQFAIRNELDLEVAKNFFGHKCKKCDKKIRGKDVIGMNMRLMGSKVNEVYCKKHLKECFDMSEEAWNSYIETFKNRGCVLF